MKFPHRSVHLFDVHLLHNNTPTLDIIERLKSKLTLEFLTGVDILYIHGDLYDQVVLFSDERIPFITEFHIYLLGICKVTGTKIRFLHGTPSHDGNQGRDWLSVALKIYPDVDFRYVTDMEIEYIEDFDIHVMYVPDEWASREEIYLNALKLLKDHDLEQVDFISGHNQFSFQFTDIVRRKISTLNEEDWVKLVRYHAFFGHVHKRNTYKKIEIGGSFDRLCHGEEEPKGFLEARYHDPDHHEIIFHENKEAQQYTTLDIDDLDYQNIDVFRELIKRVTNVLYQPDKRAFIRFRYTNKDVPILDLIKKIKPHFPLVHFTPLYKDSASQEDKKSLLLPETQYEEFLNVNAENVLRLFTERIPDQAETLKQRMIDVLSAHIEKIK